ncbi:MAG: tyrosine-type recombinase/integrase, partial [Rhizobiaceae bacterium]
WQMTLGPAYCKSIRSKPVADVSTEDVLKILTPIWSVKSETAARLRARIERVLSYARTKGWREPGENPAAWRGNLENTLPKRIKLARGHHPAMPYSKVGALLVKLRKADAMAARALELCILCASRSGEVLNAVWSEFDLDDKLVWSIPAHRMKSGKPHTVPLSSQAVTLLKKLKETAQADIPIVFPGERPKKPLSNMAMSMMLRRMKQTDLTVHGFRSSFRDFCGDETTVAREIAEQALAHKVGDATEQAYRRSSALERRRELMQQWADYLDGKPSAANVISMSDRIRA